MSRAADVAVAIVLVTGLLVLTRPGSQGGLLARILGGTFIGALGVSSGQQITVPGIVRSRGYGRRR